MSELYSIQDTTLTALGDAIRSKVIGTSELPYVSEIITTTEIHSSERIHPYEFPISVKKIKLIINLESEFPYNNVYLPLIYYTPRYTTSDSGDWVEVPPRDASIFPYEVMLNGNVFTIRTGGAYTAQYNVSYSITAIGLDENGNEFKYTPLEMVDKINELNIIPSSATNFTGECNGLFKNGNWDWFLEAMVDKLTFTDITNADSMFWGTTVEALPFSLNSQANTAVNLSSCFQHANKLKQMPIINTPQVDSLANIFNNAQMLREITDDVWNVETYKGHTWIYTSHVSMFYYCFSLRRITPKLLSNMWNKADGYYYSCYFQAFNNCYVLDELIGLPVALGNYTSNAFTSSFDNCYRLKDIIFETNDDGTAKTANWKNQAIDLSLDIGYVDGFVDNIYKYNSGITADKEVKDDATYQALKNDPDWFSADVNYSRYNHDSAVNTINSLPDCSASGTNTIKFKGASGALTDGGAINTLTEEEIAVAIAKGWSVALV